MNVLLNGIFNLSGPDILLATLALTHITIASVTIYLHRHQTHHALTLHPVVSHFFRFWLWLTTGTVTKEWVAVHRKHHAKCETTEDPHSPKVFGLKKLLLQGAELYRAEASKQETLDKYGKGTPNDWLERKLYSRYPLIGVGSMLIIDLLSFGVIGLTVFAIQMLWIPFWAAGVINGIGHYFGHRNFETPDASRNIIPWGFLIGGEELHNNHHAYPSSAKLSNKWWEIDLGWFYIRTLSFLGLAKIKKVAPRVYSEVSRQHVDMDTVRALARHRFHIIKVYGRKVIKPVIRDEYQRANYSYKALLRAARKLLIREDINHTKKTHEAIRQALERSQTLATVYQFKQQLKDLWSNTKQDQGKRIERMQTWCIDAEKTGITVLQDFAQYIRGYTEIRMTSV